MKTSFVRNLLLCGSLLLALASPGLRASEPSTAAPPQDLLIALEVAPVKADRQAPLDVVFTAAVQSSAGFPPHIELASNNGQTATLYPSAPIELLDLAEGVPFAYRGVWRAQAGGESVWQARMPKGWEPAAMSSPLTLAMLPGKPLSKSASLTFLSPLDGESVDAGGPVPLILSAVDDHGSIRVVDFFVDGAPLGTSRILTKDADIPGVPRVHRWTWDLAQPGDHQLTAWATDAQGLRVAAALLHVRVGLTSPAPSIKILSPHEGQIFSSSGPVTVEVMALGRFGGITRVQAWLDGQKAGESNIQFIRAPEAYEPVFHTIELPRVAPGKHTLVVREVGAESVASPARSFFVAPGGVIRLLEPAAGGLYPASVPLEVFAEASGREGGITQVECHVDGVKIGESTVNYVRPPTAAEKVRHAFTLHGLKPGEHEIKVRAVGDNSILPGSASIRIVDAVAAPAQARPPVGIRALLDGTLCVVVGDQALANGRVEIESSTDLIHWESIGVAFGAPWAEAGGPHRISQTPIGGAASGARYFRAVNKP